MPATPRPTRPLLRALGLLFLLVTVAPTASARHILEDYDEARLLGDATSRTNTGTWDNTNFPTLEVGRQYLVHTSVAISGSNCAYPHRVVEHRVYLYNATTELMAAYQYYHENDTVRDYGDQRHKIHPHIAYTNNYTISVSANSWPTNDTAIRITLPETMPLEEIPTQVRIAQTNTRPPGYCHLAGLADFTPKTTTELGYMTFTESSTSRPAFILTAYQDFPSKTTSTTPGSYTLIGMQGSLLQTLSTWLPFAILLILLTAGLTGLGLRIFEARK